MTGPAVVAAKFTVDGDDAVVRAVRELSAAMASAKRTSTDASQSVGRGFITIGRSAGDASQGVNKISKGFENLAAASLGLTGTQSRLIEGLLLLGGGSAVVLGVAAGASLMGLAYRKLTEDLREARTEADKLLDSLEKAARAREPERFQVEGVRAELVEQRRVIADNLRKNLAQIAGERAAAGFSLAEVINTFTGDLKRDAELLQRLDKQIADIDRRVAPTGDVTDNERSKEIAALGRLRSLGKLRAEDEARIAALIAVTREELAKTGLEAERVAELEGRLVTLTGEKRAATTRATTSQREAQEKIIPLYTTEAQMAAFVAGARERALAADRARAAIQPAFAVTFPQGEAPVQRRLPQPGDVDLSSIDFGAINANADAFLATLDGINVEVRDLGAELTGGLRDSLVSFFGSGISQGQSFLDLLIDIAAQFQAIATEALFGEIFGTALQFSSIPAAPTGFEGPVTLNRGGIVPGGQGTRDTVPAMLTPGEGVLTVREMQKIGGPQGFALLRRRLGTRSQLPPLRRGGRQHLNAGGIVAANATANVSGKIQVEALAGTRARVSDGEFLELVHRNPRAVRSALGIRK
jgi:hypothetical protein